MALPVIQLVHIYTVQVITFSAGTCRGHTLFTMYWKILRTSAFFYVL